MRSDYNVAGNKPGEGPLDPAPTYLSWFPPLRSCAKSFMGTGREIKIIPWEFPLPPTLVLPGSAGRGLPGWRCPGPSRSAALGPAASNVQLKKKKDKSLPSSSLPAPGPSSLSSNLSRLDCLHSPRHLHKVNLNSPARAARARGSRDSRWERAGSGAGSGPGPAGRVQQSPESSPLVQGSIGAKALSMYK